MKKINFLLTLFVFGSLSMACAQTADEIIGKHIDAVGGKENIAKVNSVYVESSFEIMGNSSTSKTTILAGKGFKSESEFNGQTIVQAINEKGAWGINPLAGSPDATAMPAEEFKVTEDVIYLPDPLVDYAAHGAKVELRGQEKVGEINAYKIKYTNKDGAEIIFFLDASSYQVIQSVNKRILMGQETSITSTYSNYQKTDTGLFLPNETNVDMGQFAMKMTTKKVEINKAVDPAIFEMPK